MGENDGIVVQLNWFPRGAECTNQKYFEKTMKEIIWETHLEQHLNPDGLSGDNMSAAVPCNPAQVLNIISAGEEPRALVQGVDGVDDLLLGQVGDGRAVEVPYL